MHLSLIILTTSAAALASAQVIFNTSTYQFTCPSTPPNGAYCTGPSLTSNIIIRCTGTTGQAGNCNDNLAGVPPIGVKGFAPCYESTPTAGDAACSYGGTVYPDHGPSFPVPGLGSSSNNTATASVPLTATTASSNNISVPLTALSLSTSTSYIFISSSSSSAAYTALGDNATLPTSAPYPTPSASNGTAAASGTFGTAAGKTTGSGGGTFTGAAVGARVADLGAVAAAVGLVLLL